MNDIDYILTWKSRLLDRDGTGALVRKVCEGKRYRSPVTCTPHALVGEVPVPYDEVLEEIWEIRYNKAHDRGRVLSPVDVPARLEEFKEVQNGWLDGEGVVPSRDSLDWLIGAFRTQFSSEATPNRCYLTREGRVRMEWSFGNSSMRLRVNLPHHSGRWQSSNSKSLDYSSGDLDLDREFHWEWLVAEVKDKLSNDTTRKLG